MKARLENRRRRWLLLLLIVSGWDYPRAWTCPSQTTEVWNTGKSQYHIPGDLKRVFVGERDWPLPVLSNAVWSPTPPMGFSYWNSFGDNPGPSDWLTRQIADSLVSTGLRDAGYVYFLAFDGAWWTDATKPTRDAQGLPRIDKARWPDGIEAVSGYIHQQGLKVGGYTDIGVQGYLETPEVGAFGYEQTDADQFARWGWDYIKVDDHGPGNFYSVAKAIVNNSSHRPMVLGLSTPHTFPYEFAPRIANLWRVGQDITLQIGYGAWKDILREFDTAGRFWWAQAPGRWNDLDMLVIGLVGINDEEAKSHFSMWAIRGAPLLIGADIRPPHERSFGPIPRLTLRDLEILKNKEVIAIDQDRLGASGRVISRERDGMEVDAKPLGGFASGDYAVLLLNRGNRPHDVTVTWHSLGLLQKGVSVRDLWKHSDLGSFVNQFTAPQVPPHGVVLLRVHGSVDWSLPREYEAEWSYNSLTGFAHTYCEGSRLQGATSDCVVEGIGDKPENKLQFNEVWEGKAGLYHLSIRYAAPQPRQARITVNDEPPITMRFRATATRKFDVLKLQVHLQAGANTLVIDNPTASAPDIDEIRVSTEASPQSDRDQQTR